MKKMIWLLFLPVAVFAQVNNPSVRYVAVAPSGSCSASPPVQVVESTGVVYTCNNGTWSSQAGEATGPGGAHNSVQDNDNGAFGGIPTSTFGVLSSDGLGDAPAFIPPFAVDITQPPYNAKCDGSTDDSAAIQAALNSNPAIFIPNNPDGYTQCNFSQTLTFCYGNALTGIISNTLYGNGQYLDYTGTGTAIRNGLADGSNYCLGGMQIYNLTLFDDTATVGIDDTNSDSGSIYIDNFADTTPLANTSILLGGGVVSQSVFNGNATIGNGVLFYTYILGNVTLSQSGNSLYANNVTFGEGGPAAGPALTVAGDLTQVTLFDATLESATSPAIQLPSGSVRSLSLDGSVFFAANPPYIAGNASSGLLNWSNYTLDTSGAFTFNPSPYTIYATGTYTTATSDAFTVTGATASSFCTFSPTNSTAASAAVLGYVSSVTTNSVTITHAATVASGGTVNITCTKN